MVSIHKISVGVLLIISVICFIFRFKREAFTLLCFLIFNEIYRFLIV